uniref:Uncharacterized protein n=1 Tax=Anguilla anguilla TaxID=7936 RepID=A0A0E9UYW3_ANGAN
MLPEGLLSSLVNLTSLTLARNCFQSYPWAAPPSSPPSTPSTWSTTASTRSPSESSPGPRC